MVLARRSDRGLKSMLLYGCSPPGPERPCFQTPARATGRADAVPSPSGGNAPHVDDIALLHHDGRLHARRTRGRGRPRPRSRHIGADGARSAGARIEAEMIGVGLGNQQGQALEGAVGHLIDSVT
jgi:hypothetical protein